MCDRTALASRGCVIIGFLFLDDTQPLRWGDIGWVSGIRPNSDLQIRKLFTERAAPRPGVADMVEINDEQRRGWFLSYSVGLWARPNGYGRATICRLSATFLP
jgi:hypothetical protein